MPRVSKHHTGDVFSGYHPLVNFTYFALVLAFSMVFMHPAFLVASLACAAAYSAFLNRRNALGVNLKYILPIFILTVAINPLFNHAGATVLLYFGNGNPLTLESIVYGVAAGIMLGAVINWFSCFNNVITSDKLVYLFGRLIPATSLVLAMALRLVPRFSAQARAISNAQRSVGRDISKGNILSRASCGIRILSILITWALENAVETADSMRSRGYGLPGRTAFSIYRFDKRDMAAILFLLTCGAYVITGAAMGALSFRYFPSISGEVSDIYTGSIVLAYMAMCMLPVAVDVREGYKWKAI